MPLPDLRGLRRLACGKRRIAAAGVAALALLPAVGVLAYWTAAGSGTASASVLSIDAPEVDATNPVAGTAQIDWTAVGSPDGDHDSEVEYTVERKPNTGSTWIFVCATDTTRKAYDELSCDDHPTVEDDYDYRVTAYFRSWTSQGMDTVHVVTDVIPPEVESITRDGTSPTNASSVSWTVAFSEGVTGVDATDFGLVGSGATGASITSISGSGDEYTVNVSVGDDGTLGLNLADDDSITDAANNPLGGTGAGNGDFTGEAYEIDRTAPSVDSITRDDSNPTNAASVSWTVTFSENVTGVDVGDFALTADGLDGGPTVGTVTPIDAQTYTVAASTGTGTPSGSGTLRLDVVDDDSIADGVGNTLSGGFTTGEAYTIDKTAPTVSAIDRTGTNPTNAGPLTWQVTFSEPVSSVGASNFDLVTQDIGGAAPSISSVTAVGGAPSATWNVSVATAGTTGQNSGSIRLDLSGAGSIQDAATNGLANTLAGQAYTYDTTPPTVSAIDRTGTNPTNAGPLTWQVTFSEPVSSVGASNFTLSTQNTGGDAPAVSSVTPSGSAPTATWNVSVSTAGATGANDGSIGLDLASVGSIQDAATNGLVGTFEGQAYTYDTTPPAVSSSTRVGASPTNAGSVSWTVSFSESVSGVNAADFALAASGVSGASITGVTGSGPYTVTVDTGTGSGSLGLNLVDDDSIQDGATNHLGGAGNGNGNFTGEVFTIDKTPPEVSSIDRAGATPTNAASVSWTVTFSESVSGADVGDFELVQSGGVAGASITSVTGSGPYTVSASTGSGDGSLGLNLVDDDSIEDAATNRLGGTGTGNGSFTGQVYAIDRTAPAVVGEPEHFDTNADGKIDRIVVTFDEPLESGTAGTAPWALASAPAGTSIGSVSVAGAEATLTLVEGTGFDTAASGMTLALSSDPNGVRDSAGNQSSFAATSVADRSRPIATNVQLGGNSNGTVERDDFLTVTYSEVMDASVFCNAWTNNGTNQTRAGNGVVVVTITDNGSADTLTVGASGCGFTFGSVALNANYVNATRTFSGNGANASELQWAPSSRTLTITLGTASGSVNTSVAASVPSYTPALPLEDLPGNLIQAGPFLGTSSRF